MSAMIILTGEPKSTQNIYGQYCLGKRPVRFMTKEGKDLKEQYQWEAKAQWAAHMPLTGSVRLVARFYFKTRRKADLDNFNKLLLDSMNGIVYEDDSQIAQLYLERYYDKEKPRIEIDVLSI